MSYSKGSPELERLNAPEIIAVESLRLDAGLYPEAFDVPCLLFCHTIQGSVHLSYTAQQDLQILSHCVLLIPAGMLLSWRVGLQLGRVRIVLSGDGFDATHAAMGMKHVSTDPVLEHFAAIYHAQHTEADLTAFLPPFAETLLRHFLHRKASHAEPTDDQKALRLLKEFVDQRLAYDLAVDDLARHCALSKFQLLRMMKKELNQTPQQFVIFRRIERAKDLLRRSETGLADIAFLTGFSSQSHLSNTFKQLVGVTPKSYRDGHATDAL